MINASKLPKKWAVEIDKNHPRWEEWKEFYYRFKQDNDWEFCNKYYGSHPYSSYKARFHSETTFLTMDEFFSLVDEQPFDGFEPTITHYTRNDIDFAYLIGVFNVVGLEGLSKEIDRLKSLKINPHDIIDCAKLNVK